MKKQRNPFAGQKQTGAGYHSAAKYVKEDRKSWKRDLETWMSQDESDYKRAKDAMAGFVETRKYLENELALCQAEIDAIKSEEKVLQQVLDKFVGGEDG